MGLDHQIIDELISLAYTHAPNEVCGYVTHDCRFVNLQNIADDPQNYFEIHLPHIIIAMSSYPDICFFHSHPRTRPDVLTPQDIDFILRTRQTHIIIGLHPFPMIAFYGIRNGQVYLQRCDKYGDKKRGDLNEPNHKRFK